MNVSLTPELETLVNEKVKSGDYNSASEVVREALRLLKGQDQLKGLRREELRKEVMKGAEDVRAGRYTALESPADYDDLAAQITTEGRRKKAAAKKIGKKETQADGDR